jgi:Holliday junction resolvase RusA-like endonuclease
MKKTMKKTINFTIPGNPDAKQRHRHFFNKNMLLKYLAGTYTEDALKKAPYGRFVMTYNNPEQEANEAKVRLIASQYKRSEPLTGALKLTVKCYFPIPKSFPQWKADAAEEKILRPTVKPDWDNVGKLISDAINEVIYQDDKQIVSAVVRKYYSRSPRTEIQIEEFWMPLTKKDWEAYLTYRDEMKAPGQQEKAAQMELI